jgi:hypothetical protein
VGLDTEVNELVEGSDLYTPAVQLAQLVLPDAYKERLLATVANYESFREYNEKRELKKREAEAMKAEAKAVEAAGGEGSASEDKTRNRSRSLSFCGGSGGRGGFSGSSSGSDGVSDGNTQLFASAGLVILLCGPSGTGKTMSVNAIATRFGKRVLMVDFPSLYGKKGNSEVVDLKGLFREAEMSVGAGLALRLLNLRSRAHSHFSLTPSFTRSHTPSLSPSLTPSLTPSPTPP